MSISGSYDYDRFGTGPADIYNGARSFIRPEFGRIRMAKEIVSARVPEGLAEELDDFAERSNVTRTDALERVLRAGLELTQEREGEEFENVNRVYTVDLDPEDAKTVQGVAVKAGYNTDEFVRNLLRQNIAALPSPDW